MKEYDVIVIGSGCGAIISDEAAGQGLKTALVDKGPLIGGTCLNWGCIPSKMLIYTADRIADIQEVEKFGVRAAVENIDFLSVMERMRHSREESQGHLRTAVADTDNLDLYEAEAKFTGDHTIEVKGETLKGEKIFIASGSRPMIPPVKGLDGVPYLTNESALELKEKPESLIIIGGGYIAVEFGHFFAAMGTRVTMLEMADRLVLAEEPEISEVLKEALSRRMAVHTGAQAEEVKTDGKTVTVVTRDAGTEKTKEYTAAHLMMAVGRRSNADLIQAEKAGIKLDKRGFIVTNDRLETNVKNIWAVGDANGKQMFTHMANREAAIAAHNGLHDGDLEVDYDVVPHAVYSHPQIASVGMKEEEAAKMHDILVGRAEYYDTAKGEAMMEEEGFAKVILEKETETILGFHIVGPHAPLLIQEVVNAMASGGNYEEINEGIHIHPALSELIPTALGDAEE